MEFLFSKNIFKIVRYAGIPEVDLNYSSSWNLKVHLLKIPIPYFPSNSSFSDFFTVKKLAAEFNILVTINNKTPSSLW